LSITPITLYHSSVDRLQSHEGKPILAKGEDKGKGLGAKPAPEAANLAPKHHRLSRLALPNFRDMNINVSLYELQKRI